MRTLTLLSFIALCIPADAQSLVTSSGGRSIVISGSAPKTAEVAKPVIEQPRASVVHPPIARQESPTYIVAFTSASCGPCRSWKSVEFPKLEAIGMIPRIIDVNSEPQWGVTRVPEFWVVDRKTRRALKKFKGYTEAAILLQYENPPLPELESKVSDSPRYRIYDGIAGSVLQNRSTLIQHLLDDGVHAGKHTREQLNQLGDQQLDDLHTHDHRINGQVKQLSGPVQQPRKRLPVVNTQWGRIDLETYSRNCNCPMCRGIRALQSQYRTMSLQAVSPDQEPTPDDVITQMMDLLPLSSRDVLADMGCGDGRILIAAVHRFGCTGIGIEIDPEKAEEARVRVENEGLSHKIRIVTGDVLDFEPSEHGVTAVTAYLYPELLAKLEPKLREIPVVAAPFHEIPGMSMQRIGDVWIKKPSPELN
jgi:hypothetical protein